MKGEGLRLCNQLKGSGAKKMDTGAEDGEEVGGLFWSPKLFMGCSCPEEGMPNLGTPFSKVFKIGMIVPSRKCFYSEWKNSTPLLIPVTIVFTKFVRQKHFD